jgi:hypothetical protein
MSEREKETFILYQENNDFFDSCSDDSKTVLNKYPFFY